MEIIYERRCHLRRRYIYGDGREIFFMILYDFYSRAHMCVSALSTPIKHRRYFSKLSYRPLENFREATAVALKIYPRMIFYR